MTTPHQLLLLADHVKLTLLELDRARTLGTATDKQYTSAHRSLQTLRDGVSALERQRFDAEAAGEDITDLADQISRLTTSVSELDTTYQSLRPRAASPPASANPASFDPARPNAARSSSMRTAASRPSPGAKAVRFRDDPSKAEPAYTDSASASPSARAALFTSNSRSPAQRPYRDDDDGDGATAGPDPATQSNQQIHAYHTRVLAEQDEQLDRLGLSVGRQRDLSIAMGNELDDQALLLEDVERGVDRHQGTLDRARDRLGKFSRRAKDNWSWVTIGCLLLVLVLLIVLIK